MPNPICTVDGCAKPARSKSSPYCHMHYSRLWRNGTLEAKSWHARGTCNVPGCTSPEEAEHMCAMHHARYLRHGDPEMTYRPRQVGSCSISGCDRPKESKDWCEKHARRARLNGDPLIVKQGKPASGPANHNWVGDDISYEGWHQRIRTARGSASMFECVDCGMQANDWSYDHSSDDERDSVDGPYALDMDHYAPRCRRCHIVFDAA